MNLLRGRNIKKLYDNLNKDITELESLLTNTDINQGNIKDGIIKCTKKLEDELKEMHFYLYGDVDNEPKIEQIKQLIPMILNDKINILLRLTNIIIYITFESKKHLCNIMNYIIRRCNKNNGSIYFRNNINIIKNLANGCNNKNLAINVGSVLIEICKRQELSDILFNIKINNDNDFIYELMLIVINPSFDISINAFNILNTLFKRNEIIATNYLTDNYDKIFNKINQLIQSNNYIIKRQFSKLLSDILIGRKELLLKYVNQKNNLIIHMNLLKIKSKEISYEAFHMFKVFVANPKKSKDIHIILWKNKNKLIKFLDKFLIDKEKEDAAFLDEKQIVVKLLDALPAPDGMGSNKDDEIKEIDKQKLVELSDRQSEILLELPKLHTIPSDVSEASQ